jgi:hypothetical protein
VFENPQVWMVWGLCWHENKTILQRERDVDIKYNHPHVAIVDIMSTCSSGL